MELRAETSVFDDKLLKEDVDNAQQTADNAQVIAETTAQYFWFLEEIGSVTAGVGTGAHITNITKEEFLSNPTNGGGNLLARSNGIAIRDGLTELAIFSADQLRIGRANAQRAVVNSGSLELYDAQNNKYFTVSASGLSYGSHVVATQEDITDIESTATSSTAVKTQYYLSTSASSATGGSWQDTVPTWSTDKYIWTRVATTKTTIGGTSSTSYSTAVYDRALTTALSTSESAQNSANSGASTVTTTQQFYLSTSSSSATGGSWSDSAPTWSTEHYVWTRYKIVKTTVGGTTSTSYTTGIYDKTLTDALNSAEEAKKTATNYLYVDSNGALNIASTNPSTATRKVNISASGIKIQNDANNYALVESNGMDIYQGGDLVAFFGATAIIGKSDTRHIEIKDGGLQVYQDSTTVMGHFGYGPGNNQTSGTDTAPYFTLGRRVGSAATDIGNYSISEGYDTKASGFASHAEGINTIAIGNGSHTEGYETTVTLGGSSGHAEGGSTRVSGEFGHAEGYATHAQGQNSHAEGRDSTASGTYSHAEGNNTDATKTCSHAEGKSTNANGDASHAEGGYTYAKGNYSHAEGYSTNANASYSHAGGLGTTAEGSNQTVIGKYNATSTSHLFIVGNGTSTSARANAFYVTNTGSIYATDTTVHSSDRRLKTHLSYVGDEAIDFIDKLKPAHYIKDGKKHVGFYAQDVAEVDKWDCMIGDEMNGYMTLGYMELFAPLVAYVQRLEKRIEGLERSK